MADDEFQPAEFRIACVAADDYRVSLDSAPLLLTFHASAGALRTMRDAIDAALGSAMLRSPPIAPPKETIAPPAADDDEDEDED